MIIVRDNLGRFAKGNSYWLGREGKKKNKGSFTKGLVPWNKGFRKYKLCEYCGNEFSTNYGKLTKPHQLYCSRKCRGLAQRGLNYGKRIDKTVEYIKWRKEILKRDGCKCIWCGSTEKLDVDHIKAKSKYPDLTFVISNGRTLCQDCHKKTETYGKHI